MIIGPTGNFPRGKLTDEDDGELRIGVAVQDKTLIIAFGAPVDWVGMDKDTAIDFANKILERAKEL